MRRPQRDDFLKNCSWNREEMYATAMSRYASDLEDRLEQLEHCISNMTLLAEYFGRTKEEAESSIVQDGGIKWLCYHGRRIKDELDQLKKEAQLPFKSVSEFQRFCEHLKQEVRNEETKVKGKKR